MGVSMAPRSLGPFPPEAGFPSKSARRCDERQTPEDLRGAGRPVRPRPSGGGRVTA